MLREYDFTVIAKGDVPDSEVGQILKRYEDLMTQDGGEIIKRDAWGLKKLAYPIKKAYRGHYVNYDFVGHPEHLAEIERLMGIDDNILRYLVVRIDDGRHEVDIAKRKEALVNAEREAEKRRREQEIQ